MATVNSDLKSFAIFVNSKSAQLPSTEKSIVAIPFVSNLARHDPGKTFKFMLVDMLFTNAFYNVRPNVDTLKVIYTFAEGRGFLATQRSITVKIPNKFYDYDSLSSYLSLPGIMGFETTIAFTYTGNPTTNNNCFFGFGAMPADSLDTVITPACFPDTGAGKLILQSPDLNHLIQYHSDNSSILSNQFSNGCSNLYSGVYLQVDSETIGLMHMLGFITDNTVLTTLPGGEKVIGYQIANKNLNSSGTAYNNTTLFGYVQTDGTVVWPTLPITSTSSNPSQTITPEIISDLSGLDEIYIHCQELRTQFMSSIGKGPLAPSDVIAVIPLNASYGQKMSWVPNFQLTATLNNTNISVLNFYLTNSNGVLLDFNGINWSMTLSCTEEDDESKLQQEDNGVNPTPFHLQGQLDNGVNYMQESLFRKKRRNLK